MEITKGSIEILIGKIREFTANYKQPEKASENQKIVWQIEEITELPNKRNTTSRTRNTRRLV